MENAPPEISTILVFLVRACVEEVDVAAVHGQTKLKVKRTDQVNIVAIARVLKRLTD